METGYTEDNRFYRTAKRISRDWGVGVEWAPLNREYVVEGRTVKNAAEAEKLAKKLYHEANAMMGGA